MNEFKITEVTCTVIKEVDGEKVGSIVRIDPEMALSSDIRDLIIEMATSTHKRKVNK